MFCYLIFQSCFAKVETNGRSTTFTLGITDNEVRRQINYNHDKSYFCLKTMLLKYIAYP